MPRRPPLLLALTLLVAGTHFQVPRADAGPDDVDYAHHLAEMGRKRVDPLYFSYARRLYEAVVADSSTTELARQRARFGLARLDSERALASRLDPDVPYTEVLALFKKAAEDLEAFALQNAEHPERDQALLEAGIVRLNFVRWVRDDLTDEAGTLQSRQTTAEQAEKDAREMVEQTLAHFERLRQGYDQPEAGDLPRTAQYYWVTTQYYRALVLPPCSAKAEAALTQASEHLATYVMLNDQTLFGVYAMDTLGETWVEVAQCKSDPPEQAEAYREALSWFEACMSTPNNGPDFLQVIAKGYYHYARTCLAAGVVGEVNFHRTGVEKVGRMLDQVPDIWRQDVGLRALVELARLYRARDLHAQALETLQLATEKAALAGVPGVARLAKKEMQETLASAGGSVQAEPDVLKGVADSFYNEEKWADAIRAYQAVASLLPRTEESMKTLGVDVWRRISSAYQQQGNLLGAALALEPIHEAWLDGVFSRSTSPTDANLLALGEIRWSAIGLWKQLADRTKSATFEARFRQAHSDFAKDYPNSPLALASSYNAAVEQFNVASKLRRDKPSGWKEAAEKALRDAQALFTEVSGDENSPHQDKALVYLVRVAQQRRDFEEAVRVAQAALAKWDSPEGRAKAEKYSFVNETRREARGQLIYWLAEALVELKRWDGVLQALEGYHAQYDTWKDRDPNAYPYYAGTLSHLVQAHLGKGDIQRADAAFGRLLKAAPKFYRVPAVTQDLAAHYNQQASGIEKELRALIEEQTALRPQIHAGEREIYSLYEVRAGRNAAIGSAKAAIRVYDEAVAAGEDPTGKGVSPDAYRNAKSSLPNLLSDVEGYNQRIDALSKETGALKERSAEITTRSRGLADRLYEPRATAANYYYLLHQALKEAKIPAVAGNVKIYGDLYRKAAQLRPQVSQNWERARSLYEDFLALPGISESDRDEVVGYLGTILYHLALNVEDEEARAKLIRNARDRMQQSIAKISENNSLLVAHMQGDLVAMPWKYPVNQRTYRFLVRRLNTVPEFRREVAAIGTEGGPPLPRFATDAENRTFELALRFYQNVVATEMSEAELQRLVAAISRAGFDSIFFLRHANPSRDFRLALAWTYSETGDPLDARKAMSLCGGLLRGRVGTIEEGTAEWWLAHVVNLRAALLLSETLLASGETAEAKGHIEDVSKALVWMKGAWPGLGQEERPETVEELQDIRQRVLVLRAKTGMAPLDVDLTPGAIQGPAGEDETQTEGE